MQVGDNVRKMLGAVCKITDAGNPVVFQPSPYPNYIYNWSTGKSTQMYRENGQYKVQLWMKNDPSEEEAGHESGKGDSQAVLEANAVERGPLPLPILVERGNQRPKRIKNTTKCRK